MFFLTCLKEIIQLFSHKLEIYIKLNRICFQNRDICQGYEENVSELITREAMNHNNVRWGSKDTQPNQTIRTGKTSLSPQKQKQRIEEKHRKNCCDFFLRKMSLIIKFITTITNIMKEQSEELIVTLNNTSQEIPYLSQEQRQYLQGLEGQCKIKSYTLLKISYLKIFCIALPLAFTVVGFLLIYHYRRVRARLAYSVVQQGRQLFHFVTHIYVKSQSGIDAICPVYKVNTAHKTYTLFRFEELIYELNHSQCIPLGINVKEMVQLHLKNRQGRMQGLGQEQTVENQLLNGRNEHLVKIPTYHEFLFNSLTNLKISILYLNALITLVQYSVLYSLLLLGLSLLTININYLLTYKFYRKIKNIAQKDYTVCVIRKGKKHDILKSQLIPGDVYRVDTEIPCDSILISGGAFVNEVGFTGENIPVGKFVLEQSKRVFQPEHWVYEGSPLVSHRQNTYAMVVATAFSTRKGKIIRKILHTKPTTSQYFRSILPFIGQVVVVHILLFAAFFHYMFKDISNSTIIYLRFGEFMVSSIPAFLQIEENLFKSIYLIRLNSKGIFGTDAEMTIESSRVEAVYFDKTGTLTHNKIALQSILLTQTEGSFRAIRPQQLQSYPIILKIFASCHTVQAIDGKLHGDEVDLKMFQAAGTTIQPGNKEELFIAQREGLQLGIIRVNQFESRFQSMSVLVRDHKTGEKFLFAKGSPEKLHALSTVKHSGFNQLIKGLSLEGFRTIAVSMRKIETEQQFTAFLGADREEFLQKTDLVALVTFDNALKEDAAQTIATLAAADIKTRMVTGDNLFVAVQTALSLGMVQQGQRIVALEGQKLESDGSICAVAVRQEDGRTIQEEFKVGPNGTELEGQHLAMDIEYIRRNDNAILSDKAVVFARTTPEMKALIIRKQRQKIESLYRARSWRSRTFGGRANKVAMVGDGANDLMAIREAHVGIGISESDAIYCSDFTVANLSKIPLLVRQSRTGEQNLLELTHYYYIYRFLDMTCKILQTPDFAIYPSYTGLIRNFLTENTLCLVLAFGVSSDRLSQFVPSFNMLSLHNQLTYWGSSLIVAAGITTGYYYFRSSPNFTPNPDNSRLSSNCQTATITILYDILLAVFINISVVQGKPWKKRLWKNTISLLFIAVNAIFITVVIFNTPDFGTLGLLPLEQSEALVAFLIVVGFGMACLLFNIWVQSLQLYKRN